MQSFPKTFRFSISACGTHDLCRHHSHPASIVWSPESFSKDCRYLARIHLDNELEWHFVCGSVEHVPYLQAFVNLWSTSKNKFVLKHIFIKKKIWSWCHADCLSHSSLFPCSISLACVRSSFLWVGHSLPFKDTVILCVFSTCFERWEHFACLVSIRQAVQ